MEILSKLFGSPTRVKLMRFFLFNPDKIYSSKEAASRAHALPRETEKELRIFEKVGFIKRRGIIETELTTRRNKKPLVRRRKTVGWTLDRLFPYLLPLKNLIINTTLIDHREMVRRLARAGSLKLVIAAGVFIQEEESRLDLLIVGDHLKKTVIGRVVKAMESEIGKELRYVILETSEFKYRASICDKLIRDVTDYPHQKLLDKLEQEKEE
ncbi:MAG: hypothetical protein A3G03_01500 [Candidatus Taylorbacteria bacterium RIFCSPLOWO2_12_FULL_44_15c]|uniref:Transcriptional regulator n=1 Tax=Candidatus Taylorbacteria bacterium RIFCSPLOWO2_12_FULL_44_15c TaxID=1802333 RepID=A0A1G2P711_9BACT|nr:MAG: hypothetical protein A3I97_01650 [Candidatus Taylorbacteria bacterium RIFCSPLOWO2_02_FULL_44_35]OHA44100.1 MAG: hypothetical protein A3G03_01500 [Candidatus Taylorbacteria bacterium RIFCSPLOWO2_12_FULL_44_15c]